ncbi:MAG TPA: helix-turn-helix domain-containing protein [Streptosporangiaceae bacterium]|nr:helix-turn-helix domain-containing protein [Streptosporangiaceae bacterium]
MTESESAPSSANPIGPARRRATDAEARALGSVLRLRILRLCLGEALTNKEIAQRLGRDPASVLHHVRRLVDAGFLQAMPVRRGTRGARELPYQTTGKSWRLEVHDPPEGSSRGSAMLRAFLEELDEAGGEPFHMSRLGLRLRPESLEEFSTRIQNVLDEFAARDLDADGEWWSVFYVMHPDRRGEQP